MIYKNYKNNFLKNKNILVTGASKGIGKCVTENLSMLGANIIMLSRNEIELDKIYDSVKEKYKTKPFIINCDLEDLDENRAQEVADIIFENYKNLDAVIFNAAVLEKMSDIVSYDLKTWNKVIKINLTSSFILSKYLISLMESSSNPRIIFTSSGAGKLSQAFWGAYAISKAGINSLASILSDELESVSNIKVFNFDPKATKTNMRGLAYPAEDPSLIKDPSDLIDYYLWMLSDESASTKKRFIEFGKKI